MQNRNFTEILRRIAARGGIIIFFIMAFEVMIMISPFAFFFYSVFNPILHWLQDYSATRWLTSFFLPHMILPPTLFFKGRSSTGIHFFRRWLVDFFSVCFSGLPWKNLQMGNSEQGSLPLYPPPAVPCPRALGDRDEHPLAEVPGARLSFDHVYPLLFPGQRRRTTDARTVWRGLSRVHGPHRHVSATLH